MTDLAAPGHAAPTTRGLTGIAIAIVVSTTVVSHSFGRSTFGLLLPAVEDTLGLSHGRAGIGGTIIYVAYLVGVLSVAWVAPRVEPISIMRCGLAVGAAGLAVLATAPSFGQLLVGLALAGGAGAGIWITAPAIATAEVPAARRGVVIGMLSATIGLGTFLVGMGTNAYRSATGDEGAWRAVWGLEAVVALGFVAATVLIVRPQRTDKVAGGIQLSQLRAVPNWVRVTGAYAAFGAIGAGVNSFLVTALEENNGLSRHQASTLYSAMGLCAIAGAPLLGLLSDRKGRRGVMVGVLAVIVVSMTLLSIGHGPLAVGAVGLLGLVWSSYPVLTAAYVRDHVGARDFATAFAAMTVLYSIAAMLTPAAVGWLADATGSFMAPFVAMAGLAGVAVALMASVPTGGAA